MASKLSQSLCPVDLVTHSVFHVSEILDRILTYSLSIRNFINLSLACKTWRDRIRSLLCLNYHEIESIDDFIMCLIRYDSSNKIVLSFLCAYIRGSPKRSTLTLLKFAKVVHNDIVTSYIEDKHIYSFESLTGWTIIEYIKNGYTDRFSSLENIKYPDHIFVEGKSCDEGKDDLSISFVMSVYKPNKPNKPNKPRTILIVKNDKEYLTYRILEYWDHRFSIKEINDRSFVYLNEVIERIDYEGPTDSMPQEDKIRLGRRDRGLANAYDSLNILTKSREFSLGVHDIYGYEYLTSCIRDIKHE